MMTVVVLGVLWLIVVVPMVLRRSDERRRDRSIVGFGQAMRVLGRRTSVDVFVPGRARAAMAASADSAVTERIDYADVTPAPRGATPNVAPNVAPRRPELSEFTAEEALMNHTDRAEISAARFAMMRRRRRALGSLIIGALGFTAAAVLFGGVLWAPSGLFLAGVGAYLFFLRHLALKDQARRLGDSLAGLSDDVGYEATDEVRFAPIPESVVRIDDDDLELQNMDTIDLTGIYSEELVEQTAQRRAS
jgi:hypothetical protein